MLLSFSRARHSRLFFFLFHYSFVLVLVLSFLISLGSFSTRYNDDGDDYDDGNNQPMRVTYQSRRIMLKCRNLRTASFESWSFEIFRLVVHFTIPFLDLGTRFPTRR